MFGYQHLSTAISYLLCCTLLYHWYKIGQESLTETIHYQTILRVVSHQTALQYKQVAEISKLHLSITDVTSILSQVCSLNISSCQQIWVLLSCIIDHLKLQHNDQLLELWNVLRDKQCPNIHILKSMYKDVVFTWYRDKGGQLRKETVQLYV